MEGSPIENYFNDWINSGKIYEVSGRYPIVQIIRMISKGRISATLEDRFVMQYELSKIRKSFDLKEAGCQSKTDMVHIAFSKKNNSSQDYAKILSEGIDRMKQNGEYRRILDSYVQ